MTVSANKVVLCHYTLREGSINGELIESTEGSEPLGYIQGIGMMIPTFEQHLEGKQVGEEFSFGIEAANAYGVYDDNALTEIPLAAFDLGGQNPQDLFVPGEVIPLSDDQGNQFMATVLELSATAIRVDLNHPMAGIDLYFTGRISEVREATASELDHGHVHGPGGHQH
jgi:FKBP-type peptidyl-prolyl cis-trans isomerase SlyD